MKKYLILSIAVLMSVMAQAQIVGSRNSRTTVIKAPKEKIKPVDYNQIFIGNATDKSTGDVYSFGNFYGIKAGALHGFSLHKELPVYLEVGGAVQYQNADFHFNREATMLSLKVPVNLTYKFSTRGGLYAAPYVGAIIRYNLSSKIKKEDSDEEINMFDKNEMDPTANRFQAGAEIGINIGYKCLNVNIGRSCYTEYYNNEVTDKISFNGVSFGIGYNF